MKKVVLTLFTFLILNSCSSDSSLNVIEEENIIEEENVEPEEPNEEESETEEEEQSISIEERQEFLNILSGETLTVWKIESATRTNTTGSTDISENVSIQDDEFIFETSTNGTQDYVSGALTWKKRKGYDLIEGTSDDNYYSPETFNFNIDEKGELITSNLKITLDENETVKGTLFTDNNQNDEAFIEFRLKKKVNEDYKTIPSSLNFNYLNDFDFILSYNLSTGFNASYKTNSLYLSYRFQNQTRNVYKYSLNDQSLNSIQIPFSQSEFVSSRLHFHNNKLIVFGSGHIWETDLNLNELITAIPNGLEQNLSRSGTASVDSQIYAFGGELEALGAPLVPLTILKYNNDLQGFQQEYVSDSPRRYTQGTTIDDNLYIVGGQYYPTDSPTIYLPNILVYNLRSKSTEFINLNFDLGFTSAARFENLLFFAGQIPSPENNGVLYLGAYDTFTGNLSEIPITMENLSNNDARIVAMTVLKKKLYLAIQNSGTITTQVVDLSGI
ncbi:hypothetical protein K1F50_16480 [Muricauda oceani]|uniref:Uncharacterized protein n=1 Tax=Flagellimonas oceani TaxID=2698672 RepID=A0A6G7IXA4_9FLAO|nr:hypothetical protein [Allomuricauda oceani]MBW8244408.1 hypothetical protein [Allomuricauda oceani]QII43186.1 hypothetical protein GVT53_00245 [Allomuricauda oceani]